jgi:serine/tyrosine/threonine adenylyltransferase
MTRIALARTAMASLIKYPISALPLPPPSKILIHNLTPDPSTPSVSAFKYILKNSPSIQRRARLTAPQSHFSHVSPLPLPFPYEIEPPENPGEAFDHGDYVEEWLAEREALNPKKAVEQIESDSSEPLQKLYPASRQSHMELLGLSDTCLRDCLPHLDVGDAFEILGKPTLLGHHDTDSREKQIEDGRAATTRQELVDVLGGQAMLTSGEDADVSFAPWSLRYSGHQFGQWAGQLGDGRAISIRVYFFFLSRSPYASSDDGDPRRGTASFRP